MAVRVEQHAEPIPGYRLIDRLGGGGFGEVWRAEAPGGMHKAIKFVFGDLSSAGDTDQRAKQELKALERVRTVRHPYILTLERYEVIDGQLIIVMELADRNLWDRFKECRVHGLPGIPRPELLAYMEETAEALDLMNTEYQLQHLDIKPQNLFLIYNHIKVADFGLVKDMEGSHASVTGGITPVYAAPETFDGRVTRFSDQYSLGIVYQELLTGQRPFSGTNVRQLIMQHISAVPNVSPLPPGEQQAIARSLSKIPDERFPSCRELVLALKNASEGHPVILGVNGDSKPVSPSALTRQDTVEEGSVPPSWQGTQPPSSGPVTANIRLPIPDTGSNQGSTHCIRVADQVVLHAEKEAGFKSPVEVTGAGCLVPGLVIAVGQVGLLAMQRFREILHLQVGPLAQLPHLRFLLMDTDPEVVRAATRGQGGASLHGGEVLLAPLNRPGHYVKPRDGRPDISSWLNPKMLYRIPRSQVTTGVRALGRLAFADNYRSIVRRLQLELEAILDPQALQNAARTTQLGVRTNRPRVYLLASLGGGTGSGMFIDLAYTLRALLRQMGYENPDVVGLLLVPPVDGSRTRQLPLGNTYAALTELNYFGSPGVSFKAKYHEREAPIQDNGPPFSRNVLLPLPDESDEVATQELVELCGQFLYRELATPLGKAADLARAGLSPPPWDARGQYFQTFNLFQLTWPRQALLRAIARRLCVRIVARWNSKDSKPLSDQVQQRVQEQWTRRDLSAESFIQRLQAELVKTLGRTPDSQFSTIIDPLNRGSAQGEVQGRLRLRSSEPRGLDPEQLASALAQLEQLVGRPHEEQSSPQGEPPQLVRLVKEVSDRLASEWSQNLAEISVRLIEEPTFRLAGAEEAIRQLIATIEQVLQHHEPLLRELTEKSTTAYERLRAHATGLKKSQTSSTDLIELLRNFAKWRFQSLILGNLAGAFVSLRGHLSDELREVNFCRVRLTELNRIFEEVPPGELSSSEGRVTPGKGGGIGRKLFLGGCKDLGEAVASYMEGICPEHLLELDGRMEEMLRGHFTALVHVCLTSANILKDLKGMMLATAQEFAAEHLPPTSVAEMFFDRYPDPEQAQDEVGHFFDEAATEITPGRNPRGGVPSAELCLLATPENDPAGDQFRALVQAALPNTEILPATSAGDILLYRERSNMHLTDLEQLGGTVQATYLQMNTDNFTPHSRCDIPFRER